MSTDIFGTLCNYFNNAPPSQPSPKGEGVRSHMYIKDYK
jgi:hypothetical protein